jgi:hypothetical protein
MARMLLDQGTAIVVIHEELVLMREFLMGRSSQPLPPPPQASFPATTQVALPIWAPPHMTWLGGCAGWWGLGAQFVYFRES